MKPRTQIIISLVIATGIIAGGYIILTIRNQVPNYQAPTDSPLFAAGADFSLPSQTQDTDGDGLVDWEEVLWKTDPLNPDTDGDGTLDGEEVSTNRNPLIQGPNDLLQEVEETETPTGKLTPTQALARDLLIAHYQLTKENKNDSNYSLETVLKRNEPEITAPTHTSSQLTLVKDTPEALNAYAKGFLSIFDSHFPSDQQNELQILYKALQEKDAQLFQGLRIAASAYRSAARELLQLAVPESAKEMHIDFVNSLELIAEAIDALSSLGTDPVTGMAGFQKYNEASARAARLLGALSMYFSVHQQSTAQ